LIATKRSKIFEHSGGAGEFALAINVPLYLHR